jgi:serine/threonine protein kinase
MSDSKTVKTNHKLVGEGSYGCVFKPAIPCKKTAKNRKLKYTNKISKFMFTVDAHKELAEYMTVAKIDPDEKYFLGKPTLCSPNIRPQDPSLESCKLFQEFKPVKKMEDYSILVMHDGGEDLVKFAKYVSELSANSNTASIIRYFWQASFKLMAGILLLEKKGLVHQDLKPQNIVYNKSKRLAKMIDFGLMRNVKDIVQLCRNDKNHMAEYAFWTYPFEFAFLNREAFMRIARMSFQEKMAFYEDIVQELKMKSSSLTKTKRLLKFSISFKLYFDYITRNYTDSETTEIIYKYLEDFKNMILYEIVPENYISFLNKSVKTIDGFGFALSMQYVLCFCRSYIPVYLFEDLEECFYNMMTPSVLNRYTIKDGYMRLQEILKENKWIKSKHASVRKHTTSLKNKSTIHHDDVSINRKTHDNLLRLQQKLEHRIMQDKSKETANL